MNDVVLPQRSVDAKAVPDPATAQLSVVIPTRNERDNVEPLIDRLRAVLAGIAWEAIFVDDDSNDGTVTKIRAMAQADPRIRLVHRIGRRGLSSACIEGVQASTAPYVAVMDADLQHDETLLPTMLQTLLPGDVDLVVGSRYVEGGSTLGWDRGRASMSGLATLIGRWTLGVKIADPMSGFFMLPRAVFDTSVRNLSALGFKILIDVIASSPEPLRIRELPFHFRARVAGESKLDAQVVWEYLMLLADKLFGYVIPARFVVFSLVGVVGAIAHLMVLAVILRLLHLPFENGYIAGVAVAILCNFTLDNSLTYSDRRLRGWRFLRGLFSFSVICAVGAFASFFVANSLYLHVHRSWWVAGLVGAGISAVWNYAVSSVFTWNRS